MKRKLAKLMSVFLVLCTVLTAISSGITGASAAGSPIPVVYIEGAGATIYADTYDRNSEQLNSDGPIPEGMVNSIISQLAKPLLDAYLKNDFTDYCDKLVELFKPYYSRMALDENGEPSNGAGNKCLQTLPTRNTYKNGYGVFDYTVTYDWRLDPFETARYLNDYINRVKEITGSGKVDIVCRCLGVNIFLAYVAQYGSDSINKCIMYAGGLRGFEYCGALFSGQVEVDSDSLERYVNSSMSGDDDTQRILKAIVQVANTSFMLKWGVKEVMDFYEKIYENVTPRLLRESHGSFPSYWSMVPVEYYDAAKELNFGKEPEKYAGMIEKCDRYHNEVAMHVDDLINGMIENGVEVYNVAKYGFQHIPINRGSEYQSDNTVGLISSSDGATVSETTKRLSDSYINAAEKKGTSKYISVDRCVDASTCLLPDHTWFVKNLEHDNMPRCMEYDLFTTIFNSSDYMTVFDDPAHPQYMLFNRDSKTLSPLTAENCITDEEKKMQSDFTGSTELLLNKLIAAIRNIVDIIKNFIKTIIGAAKG